MLKPYIVELIIVLQKGRKKLGHYIYCIVAVSLISIAIKYRAPGLMPLMSKDHERLTETKH